MPELQDDSQAEQKPRKLSWEEMRKLIKRDYDRTRYNAWLWGKRLKARQKKSRERQAFKKRLKKQKEHPEEVVSKKKFWVIKRVT